MSPATGSRALSISRPGEPFLLIYLVGDNPQGKTLISSKVDKLEIRKVSFKPPRKLYLRLAYAPAPSTKVCSVRINSVILCLNRCLRATRRHRCDVPPIAQT